MIDERAVIKPGAKIGKNNSIGPFTVIGENVVLGDNNVIGPNVYIDGDTCLGDGNQIFQFASVGVVPQDLKYKGEKTRLIVGSRNIIREYATLHLGTANGGSLTQVGDENLFMVSTHVAHDCIVGNKNILANMVQLAGHVIIEDNAIIGALSGIHQFVRIGSHSMTAAGSMVSHDIPPYFLIEGNRAVARGLNIIGLKRNGFKEETISDLKKAYMILVKSNLTVEDSIKKINEELKISDELKKLVEFISKSERGICR